MKSFGRGKGEGEGGKGQRSKERDRRAGKYRGRNEGREAKDRTRME